MSIADKIKSTRIQKGMSLTDLCQQTGIPVVTMRTYEKGTRIPKKERLQRIANALDVNSSFFFSGAQYTISEIEAMFLQLDIDKTFELFSTEEEIKNGTIAFSCSSEQLIDFFLSLKNVKQSVSFLRKSAETAGSENSSSFFQKQAEELLSDFKNQLLQ